MAKEVAGSFASAVTGAVADKAVSKIVNSLSRQQTPVADKLQRLERLCMRVRSTVEVSEKHDIESASLLQWRDDLKRAVALGDEVLLAFRQQAATATDDVIQGTSTTIGDTTALSFTRKALSSMARHISGAATALFTSNDCEDAKKLDDAVEALEKASENLGEFIGLLQLEASPRLKRQRSARVSDPDERGRRGRRRSTCGYFSSVATRPSVASRRGDRELQEVELLVGRLQGALVKICDALNTARMRKVEEMELEWLAHWVVFLREAAQQGSSVLHACRSEVGKETSESGCDEDELRSFVHTVESIARDDLEVFNRLVTSF